MKKVLGYDIPLTDEFRNDIFDQFMKEKFNIENGDKFILIHKTHENQNNYGGVIFQYKNHDIYDEKENICNNLVYQIMRYDFKKIGKVNNENI